ncbi:archaellin/type IV pilin N-terminal domain-containing protein [Ornithinibacillus californiensis]|uniref:archaellin/type IV pilin N-terminal domain-containing protein n=1 Tax=Ornithinibacillus californiensis TaxID=161536 RepID=UPI00064DB321|nr:archaellin/type IV pilin N-terminal domain-containing protein [Ornithinibacillus californiensis]
MSPINKNEELDNTFNHLNTLDLTESERNEIYSRLMKSVDKTKKKQTFSRLITYPVITTVLFIAFVFVGGFFLLNEGNFSNQVMGDDSKQISQILQDPVVRENLFGDESAVKEIQYIGSNIYRVSNESNQFLIESKSKGSLEVYEFKESLRGTFVYEDEPYLKHLFAGELEKNEKYNEDYPFSYKMPTYLPFEYEQVLIFEMEKGTEIVHNWYFDLAFYGSKGEEHLVVTLDDIGDSEVHIAGENRKEVKLSNGTQAIYMFNGSSQTLAWVEGQLIYSISAQAANGVERYPVDELIKVANSFERYK